MMEFVILPHQLFDKKYLDKKYNYILWEHPHYFKKYKYNKKKLILHFGSMKYYYDYLKNNNFKVKYLKYSDTFQVKKYLIFDPIDKIKLPGNFIVKESPNFLLTKDIYAKYRKKTDKFFFNAFYMFGKKEINVIPNIKSQDKFNRKKLGKDVKIPNISSNISDKKYVGEGIKRVKEFKNNYGNVNNFIYPLSHLTAKKWLQEFIKNKFKDFGPYQDYIDKDRNFLFHSMLSTSINIGLLNPSDIIKEIMKYKEKIPLNSFEGYIRQLFWREYQRYCYIYYDFEKKNYFGNNKKLTKSWYNGTTKIDPIDTCIKNGFNTGYLHHIERLMVVGNYMNLCGISPKEGFKWFMEFSCDSYEWVMCQNVYDMVFFVSGGATMRRPYASSSNYVLKMSNYKKGKWSEEWNKKYQDFLKNNKDKLHKFRYYFPGLKKL
jgi:deoxyribodipyrimidine photolyase-related protein